MSKSPKEYDGKTIASILGIEIEEVAKIVESGTIQVQDNGKFLLSVISEYVNFLIDKTEAQKKELSTLGRRRKRKNKVDARLQFEPAKSHQALFHQLVKKGFKTSLATFHKKHKKPGCILLGNGDYILDVKYVKSEIQLKKSLMTIEEEENLNNDDIDPGQRKKIADAGIAEIKMRAAAREEKVAVGLVILKDDADRSRLAALILLNRQLIGAFDSASNEIVELVDGDQSRVPEFRASATEKISHAFAAVFSHGGQVVKL